MEVTQINSEKIKLDFKDSKYATGRRKTSIAKVWLKKGLDYHYYFIITFQLAED